MTKTLLALAAALTLLAGTANAQGTGMRPGITRPITSGATDTATAADYLGWIAWKSATASGKTETLPACAASINGMWIGVADAQNTGALYNITVTAASGNVGGSSGGFVITSNLGAAIFNCDGAGTNWIVSSQFAPGANVRAVTGTTDTVLATDNGGLVTYNNGSAVAVTLPQAGTVTFPSNSFFLAVRNYGAGTVTITPTTSTINNGGSSLALTQNQSALIYSDGSANYQAITIGTGGGGGLSGMTAGQLAVAATSTTVTSSVFLQQYLAGLIPSNDGTTPNTVIDVSKGVAADDTNVLYATLASNFTKSFTSTVFSAGSGNQCHDTATAVVASTWYYLFLISNASGSTVDILCSASITAPTLPAGYTLKRWIGEFATDGSSNIRRFNTVDGHLYKWQVATVTTSTATTSQTLVTLDLPLGINIEPLCRVAMSNAAAATVLITDPYVTDAAPTAAATVPFTAAPGWDLDQVGTSAAGDINAACPPGILTNIAGQVATHASATATTVNFVNKGWRQ